MDATDEFNAIHSTKAKKMLADYYIGDLVEEQVRASFPVGWGGSFWVAARPAGGAFDATPPHELNMCAGLPACRPPTAAQRYPAPAAATPAKQRPMVTPTVTPTATPTASPMASPTASRRRLQ
jgi:hypothetical protein